MPRYFFHLHHREALRDTEGVELPDDRQAWAQATRSFGELMQDIDGDLRPGPEWRLDVADADGRPVFAIHVSAEWFRSRP